MGNPPARSPRIERLERDLASGNAAALDAFWRDIEAQGAPLVEPIDGDPDRVLITFVYRADASTTAVAMVGTVAGFGLPHLTRLASTDLFYRSVTAPCRVRTTYQFLPAPPADNIYDIPPERWQALQAEGRFQTDPLNPLTFQCGVLPMQSVIELAGAETQPWLAMRVGVPQGNIEPHRFESDILGGARVVWWYTPAGYDPSGAPYPLSVFYDGYQYVHVGAQHTLDNLIDAKMIPPMICVFVQPADRNIELACDETFARAMASDLVRSWLPARLRVTDDPRRTVVGGVSYGGLAAMFAALRHPDVFGNVISQSGSFWFGPGTKLPADMADTTIDWEWLTHEVATPMDRRIRAYLEVGVLETSPAGARTPDMIGPNRRMRAALLGAGHDVRYREFNGGHDFVCWRGSIADALIAIAGPWV